MRIVGGRWAGTPLVSPGGRVRPTAEDVRAQCMHLLAKDVAGATVLDLFAGSGALGLEALSRGARSADFVENQAAALHSLKANIRALRARDRSRVFKRDALAFLQGLAAGAYDVALADPPYTSTLAEHVVRRWMEVPFAAVLLVEHASERTMPGPGRRRSLGDTAVTVFRRRAGAAGRPGSRG